MAEFPYMPLWTDAYAGDTRHLTTMQHGAYLLLLMAAWRMPDCDLPDDDTFLSRIAGLDKRTWSKNKLIIMSFWRLNSKQRWYQKRQQIERKNVDEKRNKNAYAAFVKHWKNNNSTPPIGYAEWLRERSNINMAMVMVMANQDKKEDINSIQEHEEWERKKLDTAASWGLE